MNSFWLNKYREMTGTGWQRTLPTVNCIIFNPEWPTYLLHRLLGRHSSLSLLMHCKWVRKQWVVKSSPITKGDLFLKILFCSISSLRCCLISDYKYNELSDALLWEELYLFLLTEKDCVKGTLELLFYNERTQCTQASNFLKDPNKEWMWNMLPEVSSHVLTQVTTDWKILGTLETNHLLLCH